MAFHAIEKGSRQNGSIAESFFNLLIFMSPRHS
jgi:hypothetical protein